MSNGFNDEFDNALYRRSSGVHLGSIACWFSIVGRVVAVVCNAGRLLRSESDADKRVLCESSPAILPIRNLIQ
jgi:hypothetical protein